MDLVAGTVACKCPTTLVIPHAFHFLTGSYSFMAASKVLGEESVKEQAQQQGGGHK